MSKLSTSETVRFARNILPLLAILLGACAHEIKSPPPPETRVAYTRRVDPNAPAPYQVESDNDTYNIPATIENPPPQYPPQMIALGLDLVTVQAKVIVNGDGAVDEVRIAPNADAAMHPLEFDTAVHDAVVRWRYTPLRHTRWERIVDAQGNEVDSRIASVETKPFSVDYEFRFELRDGKPVVNGSTRAK